MADDPGFVRRATERLAADAGAWTELRDETRALFDRLAPEWQSRVGPHHHALLDAALRDVPEPRVAVDLGTGTGVGADGIAARFPAARVVGVDLAEGMIREARRRDHVPTVDFAVGDGDRLPFRTASVDLVVGVNAFIFADEVARILAPDGTLAVLYSRGEDTPIFLASQPLRAAIEAAGLTYLCEQRAAEGLFHLARR